jgi:DNA polymerase III subunit chi
MTAVAFHFNAPAKLPYTCRLLRKAVGAGHSVAVVIDAPGRAKLDEMLWSFSAPDFLPHALFESMSEPERARTPIWLCVNAEQAQGSQVLVNLTQQMPTGIEHFDRVIEIVSEQEADRQAARIRWKQYSAQGFEIVRHDVAQAA